MKLTISKKRLRELIKEELEAASFKEGVLGKMGSNKPIVGADTIDPLRMERLNKRFEGLQKLDEKQKTLFELFKTENLSLREFQNLLSHLRETHNMRRS